MRVKLPLGLMIFFGIVGFTDSFVPHPWAENAHGVLRNKLLIVISVFALALGIGNLISHHVNRIKRKGPNWVHSYTTLISLGVSTLIGVLGGVTGDALIRTHVGSFKYDITTIYFKILVPLQSTMFALLAFFMASAAYRSFRARNLLAGLLLGSAFVVMLGQVPIGELLTRSLPAGFHASDISTWIMQVPNTASKRAIDLGLTLGVLATMLKILTGIERSWLGGGR
jgi:hypothetical protein